MTLYSIFRSPVVQTYLARSAAAYISEELKTDIKIGGFNIDFYLYFVVEDIFVKSQKGDTILTAEKILINIHNVDFVNKFLKIKQVEFENAKIHLRKYENDSLTNIQFLVDYFKPSKKNIEDSISDENKQWAINCKAVKLINSQFSYYNFNNNSIGFYRL